MLRAALVLALVLVCATSPSAGAVAVAHPTADSTSPAAGVERFVGRYQFIGGQADRARLAGEIDRVVSGMGLIKRAIARRRLTKATKVGPTGIISLQGEELTIECEGARYTAPLDGRAVAVRSPGGDPLSLTHRFDGRRLIQRFEGDGMGRQNVLELDGRGGLVIRVTVWADKLPRPLDYVLHYRRAQS